MQIIGIVGGIASGKSEVAHRLQQWGAAWLDADRLGHDVLAETAVQQALRGRWGSAVFRADGSVNRRAIAERVFGEGARVPFAETLDARRFLEQLTHPRIRQRLRDQLRRSRDAGLVPAVVFDAALLLEAGWDGECDWIVFVDAPRDLRRERAVARGWSVADWEAREAAQASLDDKRARADVVFDNSGDRPHLYRQVDAWWRTVIGTGPAMKPPVLENVPPPGD